MQIKDYFNSIEDPRIERSKQHSLDTIFSLTTTTVICGIKAWEQIAMFGRLRQKELSSIIDFTNGVPSHDTIERVFSLINPDAFHTCFVAWTSALYNAGNKLIAIDGKIARRSFDTAQNKQALYLVNAWASENKLVLGQFKTQGKGHEIAGIKDLLNILDIKGSIISLDALGCQKEIVSLIVEKKADYIIAVKDNQEQLRNDITSSFSIIKAGSVAEQIEKNNGRTDVRKCTVISNLKMIEKKAEWVGVKSIIQIESKRMISDKEQTQVRYYISSLEKPADEFNKLIRSHWGIENSLHWILDMNFDEDKSRKRKGHSSQNFALVNKVAINLLNEDKETKLSMTHKKLKANYDIDYVKRLINFDA
ncbi:MAG: ISAs1 family transposase [Bacteroidetes bacterium]|nr:MAG: ISAs1 family transposase [Bacteroidota bacterium]